MTGHAWPYACGWCRAWHDLYFEMYGKAVRIRIPRGAVT